jgi:DNA-binding CsgD family transcriptional regulator
MTATGPPRQPPQGDSPLPGETAPPPPRSPAPSRPRPVPSASSLLQLSHRLTPRDLHLAGLLAEHRTLTTAQITAQLFTHPGTARNRLRQLREIGFLDRFTHRTPDGARVTCWVSGLLAARYAALADDRPAPTPRAVRTAQDRILANPQLDHLLGVNQFFTDLITHARTHSGARLTRWWSAERTAATYAGRIHPDGHGLWATAAQTPDADDTGDGGDTGGSDGRSAAASLGFWVEHDTGSMPVTRLVRKLQAYRALQERGGPCCAVLLWLPSRTREGHVHEALSRTGDHGDLVVATGVHDRGRGDPAGTSWLMVAPFYGRRPPRPTEGARIPLSALPRSVEAPTPG